MVFNISIENYMLWRGDQPDRNWLLQKHAIAWDKRPKTVPGYFAAVPKARIPKTISFALIDVGLLRSQLDALAIVAARLAPGGLVVIHKCGLRQGSAETAIIRAAVRKLGGHEGNPKQMVLTDHGLFCTIAMPDPTRLTAR